MFIKGLMPIGVRLVLLGVAASLLSSCAPTTDQNMSECVVNQGGAPSHAKAFTSAMHSVTHAAAASANHTSSTPTSFATVGHTSSAQ